MGQGRRPAAGGHTEVAYRDGQQAVESLPMPIVFYPGYSGAFFAFAGRDEPDRLYLCSCMKPAVANFLALCAEKPLNSYRHRMAPLDSSNFPLAVAVRSLETKDPWGAVEFAPKICHRCNVARPSLNYCHPMYGGQFMQGFGWYVNQAFYRLGMVARAAQGVSADGDTKSFGYSVLDEVCPEELVRLVEQERGAAEAYRQELDRLNRLVYGPSRGDIAPDEVTFWHNVKLEEAVDYTRLQREARQARRRVTTFVENVVRQEFGFRKVGEGWVSETLLWKIVCRLLPCHAVIRHHRPEWLEGLELDLYIPDLNLGIEYQGQQHFHAVKAWGGDAGLARVRKNDARKAELCRGAGVALLTVDYTESLTEEHVGEVLSLRGG